jgi:hypothetical protein
MDFIKNPPKVEKRTTLEDIYDIAEVPDNFNKVCRLANAVQDKFMCNKETVMCIRPNYGETKCYTERQADILQREKEERDYYLSGKPSNREISDYYYRKLKNADKRRDYAAKTPRERRVVLKAFLIAQCNKPINQKQPLCSKKN